MKLFQSRGGVNIFFPLTTAMLHGRHCSMARPQPTFRLPGDLDEPVEAARLRKRDIEKERRIPSRSATVAWLIRMALTKLGLLKETK